jgi:8-oxo-dGTP pyrophosphatase MutT (NUDIX family)
MSLPIVVRAFVFNPEWQILLAKHTPDAPWVLPWGHVEPWESLHEAIERELTEEFGIKATFFEMDSEEILHHRGKKLTHFPLPLSIYELHYTNKDGKDKSRIEYIFLMEVANPPVKVKWKENLVTDLHALTLQTEEIAEYAWFEADDILMMQPNSEIYDFIIEMLEKILGSEEE